MVTLRVSNETHVLICQLVASCLDAQMLNGRVFNWDEDNEFVFRALLDLNLHTGLADKG